MNQMGTPASPHKIQEKEFSRTKFRFSKMSPYLRIVVYVVIGILILSVLIIRLASPARRQVDRIPAGKEHIADYFKHFEGRQDCGIDSKDLYEAPPSHDEEADSKGIFCKNRASLLEAMTGGGRHGFDAPFKPKGCQYRWYTTAEICMILTRFDAVVFVGDDLAQQVYKGLNILLRENMALGALKQWEMSGDELNGCRCENQFVKPECHDFAIKDSDEVLKNDGSSSHRSPYFCNETPHLYLPIASSPMNPAASAALVALLSRSPDSYKPIPIIHTLSLSTSLSWPATTSSMDELISITDSHLTRPYPILFLGPVAAGHLKPPGQIMSQGNNALWHFGVEMAKEARVRDIDVLGLYNATLQAGSWDGSGYGEGVNVVVAMMVINWLARVEST